MGIAERKLGELESGAFGRIIELWADYFDCCEDAADSVCFEVPVLRGEWVAREQVSWCDDADCAAPRDPERVVFFEQAEAFAGPPVSPYSGPTAKLNLRGFEILRMDRYNPAIAPEVFHIEGQDVRDSMHIHCRNQSRVVSGLPRYPVAVHKLAPLRVHGIGVVDEPHDCTFYSGKNPARLTRKESQAIIPWWSGANGPAFDQVLRGNT